MRKIAAILIFVSILSVSLAQLSPVPQPQQSPQQQQPVPQQTVPTYPIPQWIKRGLVLIYTFQATQGGGQQQMPVQQITGKIAFLIEDTGQYNFAFRMFQIVDNPPAMMTSVSGGSGTFSNFHVHPQYFRSMAGGANPNVIVQGNTITMRGQGGEQRITIDPNTGIVLESSVIYQGAPVFTMRYAGYTQVNLPAATGIPQSARNNLTYNMTVQSPQMGSPYSIGTVTYVFAGEQDGLVSYNMSVNAAIPQQQMSPVTFGGSFEGPIYVNPQVLRTVQPGGVIYSIQNLGVQLMHGGMEGNFVKLVYAFNGSPFVTEYIDPNTGIKVKIVTQTQMGTIVQQLTQMPQQVPGGQQIPGPSMPGQQPSLPGGQQQQQQPPLPPSGQPGGQLPPPSGGLQPTPPTGPMPGPSPTPPSGGLQPTPPTGGQIPGPSPTPPSGGLQPTPPTGPMPGPSPTSPGVTQPTPPVGGEGIADIVEYNEYPVPTTVQKGLVLFRRVQEVYPEGTYSYSNILIIGSVHQGKALALGITLGDDIVDFEAVTLTGLSCAFVNPSIVQELIGKGFQMVSQGHIKAVAADLGMSYDWIYDERTGFVKQYTEDDGTSKTIIQLVNSKTSQMSGPVQLRVGSTYKYKVREEDGSIVTISLTVKQVQGEAVYISMNDSTGFSHDIIESVYVGDFYISPAVLEGGFFNLNDFGVNASVSKQGNTYILKISTKGAGVVLTYDSNGILIKAVRNTPYGRSEVELVR